MKEAVSFTSIFQIVILFILLFTAIMCLTINNANAFGVKDAITNIIELSGGKFLVDGQLNDEIVKSISESSYRTTGKCPVEYTGYQKNGSQVDDGGKASICIRKVNTTSEMDDYLEGLLGETVATDDFMVGVYYQVIVFYQLDLPIISGIYNFQTKGETKIIYNS